MSALELNDREDPSSLSDYAPRHRGSAANDSSIRPVLARLRREAGDHPLVDSGPLMPNEQPLGAADGADARARLLSMGARFAAIAALCAGTATLGYFMQARPQEAAKPLREDRAAVPPTATPKPVQTVSFKSQARLGDAAISATGAPVSSAETEGRPLRDSAEQVVDGQEAENSAAAPSLLPPLGMMPAAPLPAEWSPPATDGRAVDTEPSETTQAAAKEHAPKEHHVAHSHRFHHYRHHHHRRVARAVEPPQPAADASPPEPAQPSFTDLLRKIFKSD